MYKGIEAQPSLTRKRPFEEIESIMLGIEMACQGKDPKEVNTEWIRSRLLEISTFLPPSIKSIALENGLEIEFGSAEIKESQREVPWDWEDLKKHARHLEKTDALLRHR